MYLETVTLTFSSKDFFANFIPIVTCALELQTQTPRLNGQTKARPMPCAVHTPGAYFVCSSLIELRITFELVNAGSARYIPTSYNDPTASRSLHFTASCTLHKRGRRHPDMTSIGRIQKQYQSCIDRCEVRIQRRT